ncbi:MAG TPA: endolytic transglycosylase MltG [Bacteroidota bacterium]
MTKWILRALVLLLVGGIVLIYEILWGPNSFGSDRFVIVSKGESFVQILDSFDREGIIRSRLLFDAAGRLLGLTTKMQIGKYRFRSGMSNTEMLEDLRFGKTIEPITVTIPEGLKSSRQARIFARSLGIDSLRFMTLVYDSTFAHSLGVLSPSLEGYLMPDTYKLYWQMDEEEIIKDEVAQFWRFMNDTLLAHADSSGRSLNDILAMASIVDAETKIDSERAVVAGVYYNRLEKKMRLEADPTIQFILEDGPRRLKFSDLYRESAYNTYRHTGLTPGPINNPGRASIRAALYPVRHKFLFFVANGMGGHTFTRSYNQHRRAAQRFRKFREEQQVLKEED